MSEANTEAQVHAKTERSEGFAMNVGSGASASRSSDTEKKGERTP